MREGLLERNAELGALLATVEAAAAGRSSVVLLFGEAGIGKSSLVRSFLDSARESARTLVGVCDDLVTLRTFGSLRDAAGPGGALATALTGEPEPERVYRALLDELSAPARPTVLVIEDVQWVDDATLDALRYLVRRLERLRAVIVLTYRDDEIDADHQLRRLLGTLAGPSVRRIALSRLSAPAVASMCVASGLDTRTLYEITRGNPFFVSEVLAAPTEDVPATVVDAVMARIGQLAPQARAALQQLSVVPSGVESWLVTSLLGGFDPVAEAEQRGIVEFRADGLAFRHELARRAVERTLPMARRIELNRAVVDALLERDDADLARIVHHAVAARDVETLLARGPAAAREAARAGSHRQALAHQEHVVAYVDRLPDDAQAQILVEYAWQLYAAQRWLEGVKAAQRSAELWEGVGDPIELGEALVVLSRCAYMAGLQDEARTAIERAEAVLARTGRADALAYAQTYHGALLALTDQFEAALELLSTVRDRAVELGRPDLEALCLNYRGGARVNLGDPGGTDDLRASVRLALSISHHEYAARGYTNLGEVLNALRRYDELEHCIGAGLPYTVDHDLPGHSYNLNAHRGMLLLARGQWDEAEAILRDLVAPEPDPGHLALFTLPPLGRLLARRGDPEAVEILRRGWELAKRADTLGALASAGLAMIEWAWLSGDVDRATEQITVLLARSASTGGGGAAARCRGQLLGYLRRAGRPVEPFDGCPDEWAAALRDDWRVAAAVWERIGEPYERALELAGSGQVAETLVALEILDGLGATAATRLVRQRLRELGVVHVPRGPQPATRANPYGLTDRQVDVLGLVATGLTNAEIAERLVLSTRTVDHHVSAILTKLDVPTRKDAARIATGLTDR